MSGPSDNDWLHDVREVSVTGVSAWWMDRQVVFLCEVVMSYGHEIRQHNPAKLYACSRPRRLRGPRGQCKPPVVPQVAKRKQRNALTTQG